MQFCLTPSGRKQYHSPYVRNRNRARSGGSVVLATSRWEKTRHYRKFQTTRVMNLEREMNMSILTYFYICRNEVRPCTTSMSFHCAVQRFHEYYSVRIRAETRTALPVRRTWMALQQENLRKQSLNGGGAIYSRIPPVVSSHSGGSSECFSQFLAMHLMPELSLCTISFPPFAMHLKSESYPSRPLFESSHACRYMSSSWSFAFGF